MRHVLAIIAAIFAAPAMALTVGNDRGGLIAPRAALVASLRASGEPVRIVGRVCYSSCTMFLALPSACVSPDTRFGFHGPSNYGRPLPPADFEYWSGVMADHLPASVRGPFMREWRFNIGAPVIVSGAELIRAGMKGC